MAECGVCWDTFEKEGAKCPKLLPCIHTFCISCLKTLAEDGEIQCPLCRTIHQIPSEHIENLPTNHGILKSRRNQIYTLPSSGVSPRIDGGIGICELHRKPAISITYNTIDSTQRRFCETCLNLDSYVVSEQDSGVQEEEESSFSFLLCLQSITAPRSGARGRGNGNGELTNNPESNGLHEIVLLPSSLPATNQPNRTCAVQHVEQAQNSFQQPNRKPLMKMLKRLGFILSPLIFISGLILIAVVTIPIGFTMGFGYTLYCCAHCRCCDGFIRGFKKFVGQFIKYLYNKYACLILSLFGCIDEEDDSFIIRKLCWAAAEVVIFLVFAINIFAFIGLLSLPLLLF